MLGHMLSIHYRRGYEEWYVGGGGDNSDGDGDGDGGG